MSCEVSSCKIIPAFAGLVNDSFVCPAPVLAGRAAIVDSVTGGAYSHGSLGLLVYAAGADCLFRQDPDCVMILVIACAAFTHQILLLSLVLLVG